MVNQKIFEISKQLEDVVKEQMVLAQKALKDMPESETKENLKSLLRKASSGKLTQEDAQNEINKIVRNAH